MFALSRHHLDIVFFKAGSTLRSEASKTHLSFLWWVIDPILSMAVYFVVFGVLLQRGTEDFVPFLLIGLVAWQWLGNAMTHAANSINNSANLISQIRFPKVILPSIHIAIDTFKFVIVLALLLIFLLAYGFRPTSTYLWLPLLLAVQYLFIVGCSYSLAALVPFVPDIQHVLSHLTRMWMYLSGVMYPLSLIPSHLQDLFLLNPMAFLISSYRDILMYDTHPDLIHLGVLGFASLTLVALSQWSITRLDATYPRLVIQR